MSTRALAAVAALATFLFTSAAYASNGDGTPDGEPPADESVCDSYEGNARAHCIAACEAQDCELGEGHGKSCAKLREKFEAETGEALPCDDTLTEGEAICRDMAVELNGPDVEASCEPDPCTYSSEGCEPDPCTFSSDGCTDPVLTAASGGQCPLTGSGSYCWDETSGACDLGTYTVDIDVQTCLDSMALCENGDPAPYALIGGCCLGGYNIDSGGVVVVAIDFDLTYECSTSPGGGTEI